jgi:simple sugar transport system ATP-binding protein
MLGISKTFPGVRALEKVDLRLKAGEVHALLGENGAGKSTLIKVLTGVLSADEGEIRLDGKPVHIHTTPEAQALGISTVYQEVNLIPTMSVTKNLMLQRRVRNLGVISWRQSRDVARQRLRRLNLDIDVERPLGSYSVAIQQLVAIARALEEDTRVLVLDEPTASLDAAETELLFQIVRDLKSQGIAIVFITHFIDQVYQISDRISVLRNGRLVGEALTAELPQLKLISMMIGRELEQVEARLAGPARPAAAEPILVAEGLGRKRTMEPFDLSLRPGQVVGLAGLLGSGRTETAKLVFGAFRSDSGRLTIRGHHVAHNSTRQALRNGVAFCPEDRKAEGLVGELSVRENIMLGLQLKRGWYNLLSQEQQKKLAEDMIQALNIATPDAEKPVNQLSGGNQQKVVLARSLASQPTILILDEPTRGIDVGAHAEIVALIRRLCNEGMALLVASSELDELVAVSDRVAVLRDRKMIGEMVGDDITRDNIIHTIAAG